MRAHLATLVQDFRQHAAETAVVAHRGNRRYATSYGELAELAGRFAAELMRRGVAPGERVVLWGQNSAEWIAAFFGCLLRGVIAVPLDAAGTSKFAARVVKDVMPKLIVGDQELLRGLGEEDAQVPRLIFAELDAQLPATPEFAVSAEVHERAPFQIVFTSGTTSEPKGIVHTHRNVLVSLQPIETEIAKYRKYERWFHPLGFLQTIPLSHVFGQFMGLWVPTLLAAEVHFVDQLSPQRMVELIHREHISVLIAVPRVVQLLRSQVQGQFPELAQQLQQAQGLSVWKRWWRFRRVHRALGLKFWAVISGGASLPGDLEAFWNRLGFALVQGYGMTETAAVITLNHPFHVGKGTIGKTLPGREVKLSDEGEILVRGEMLAGATWQGGKMKPREGEWLATGDLAAESEAGELRFLGRKGDAIVTSGGMNVHPADLERAMTAQTGVRACVVVPCEIAAEMQPVAVVLSEVDEKELQAAVSAANRTLAEYQQIRRVLRWPELELPYTSTGKLLRRKVAEWACAVIAAGQRGASGAEDSDELRAMIAEVTGERVSAEGDQLRLLEDLHLDSLGRVQLLSMLEQRMGIELQDDPVAGAETMGDLRGLIAGADPLSGFPPAADSMVTSSSSAQSVAENRADVAQAAGEENVYPRWPWSWAVQAVRVAFGEGVVRVVVWGVAKPRVVRVSEDFPAGPVLIISNHVTTYDGPLVLYALPGGVRGRVAAMMSGEMLMDLRKGRGQGNVLLNLLAPMAYWLLTALFNVFPLPRLRGFRRSFAHAGEALDRGYSVLVFPEGRRSHGAAMQGFRPGIGLLARESNVPVLPVFLRYLPVERGWFHGGRVTVVVGKAIKVDLTVDAAELTAMLEESVRRLGGMG